MRALILNEKQIDIVSLPKKVDGVFWLHADDEKEKVAVIEAHEGKWYLFGVNSYQIFEKSSYTPSCELCVDMMICLKSPVNQATKNIFVLDDFDFTFHAYRCVNLLEFTMGKDEQCVATIRNPFICDNKIKLQWIDNNFYLLKDRDEYVYINFHRDSSSKILVKNGDEIFWYGIRVLLFQNYLFLNNPMDSVSLHLNNLLPLKFNLTSSNYKEIKEVDLYSDEDYHIKTPRLRRFIETFSITITPPPAENKLEEVPFILLLAPMLTTGISSSVSLVNVIIRLSNGETTLSSSWTTLLTSVLMLMGTLLWPNLTKSWQRKQKIKKNKERVEKYTDYLANKSKAFEQEIVNQQQILKENLLSLQECYNIIMQKQRILWERKISQQDFLTVRLGIGDVPLDVDVSFNEDDFVLVEDELKNEATKLLKRSKIMKDMPVSYSFYNKNVTSITGQESSLYSVLNNIVLQLIAYHGFDELKFVVFTNQSNEENWNYFKYLPHVFSDDKQIRFFATNEEESMEINDYLMQEFVSRANKEKELVSKEESDSDESKSVETFKPYYLIFTDDYPSIRKLDIISNILNSSLSLGFSLVVRDARLRRLPSECNDFINISGDSSAILAIGPDRQDQTYFVLDSNTNYPMINCARVLANIPIEMEFDRRNLPESINFLEMYRIGKVEQFNLLNRWRLNDSTKSLRSLVGVNDLGQPIYLDLHEKKHGPHGLIAGTTGSGKSEFIITYILSLALNYSPNDVSFILIDYKGGGLAGAFANAKNNIYLPHLAGTITNLDKNELNRTLISIDSELKRRQVRFNEAREILGESTMDIYKYQRFFHEGRLTEAMPHLFIICDEFAELKNQQPDFMDNLISTARIGRSLGVHLILATQKPSGVVNDQIWSNSKFRVCLKVQNTSDSSEMLKKPDAALIKNAGRFYLQVGMDEVYVLGQSGWAGASYIPQDIVEEQNDRSIDFVDRLLNSYKNVPNELGKKILESKGDQLTNVLQYICTLARKENLKSKQLWFDNIPGVIYLDKVIKKYHVDEDHAPFEAIIGEYDDPSNQYQGVLKLTLDETGNTIVYGLSGVGKEMFLKSLIFSASILNTTSQINFYIIDFGSESLRAFGHLPHVADIAFQGDDEKITKMISFLLNEISLRKKMFADYNGEYSTYCKSTGEQIPILCFVLNNLDVFRESYSNMDDIFIKISRDGKRYGIIMILTVTSSSGLFGRFTRNFDHVFVMDMNNKDDYVGLLGKIGNVFPASFEGRGLFKKEIAYEFQCATVCDSDKLISYVNEVSRDLLNHNTYKPKRIPVLPEVVSFDFIDEIPMDLEHVPIGLNKNNLSVATFNFKAAKASILSAQNIESIIPFVSSLFQLFKKMKNISTVVIDLGQIFKGKNLNVEGYCATNGNGFLDSLDNFIDHSILNTQFELVVFIINVDKFMNSVDKLKFKKLLDKVSSMSNVSFVYVDQVYSLKKYVFEAWYTSSVNNVNGLWIGSNVVDQGVIKISDISKNHREKISNQYAWNVKNGTSSLVKLVGVDKDEE